MDQWRPESTFGHRGQRKYSFRALNLRTALDAHTAWKARLEAELSGESDDKLDVSVVGSDCQCVLGKWLHGTGKKLYAKLPEYQSAVKAHADFHLAAAEVVIEHQSGSTETARNLLKSNFRTASNNNQLELVRLFSAAQSTRK